MYVLHFSTLYRNASHQCRSSPHSSVSILTGLALLKWYEVWGGNDSRNRCCLQNDTVCNWMQCITSGPVSLDPRIQSNGKWRLKSTDLPLLTSSSDMKSEGENVSRNRWSNARRRLTSLRRHGILSSQSSLLLSLSSWTPLFPFVYHFYLPPLDHL